MATRKRQRSLTVDDVPRIRALIAANPDCTCAMIARLTGRHRSNMAQFADKHGLVFPRRHIEQPLSAPGLIGDILRLIEEQKRPQTTIAKQLQIDPSTITRWRSGQSEPTLFLATCLAEIAGYRLVLEKIESASEVSKTSSNSA